MRLGQQVHPTFVSFVNVFADLMPRSARRVLKGYATRLAGTDDSEDLTSLALAFAAATHVAPLDISPFASECRAFVGDVLADPKNREASPNGPAALMAWNLRERQAEFHDDAADAFTLYATGARMRLLQVRRGRDLASRARQRAFDRSIGDLRKAGVAGNAALATLCALDAARVLMGIAGEDPEATVAELASEGVVAATRAVVTSAETDSKPKAAFDVLDALLSAINR